MGVQGEVSLLKRYSLQQLYIFRENSSCRRKGLIISQETVYDAVNKKTTADDIQTIRVGPTNDDPREEKRRFPDRGVKCRSRKPMKIEEA